MGRGMRGRIPVHDVILLASISTGTGTAYPGGDLSGGTSQWLHDENGAQLALDSRRGWTGCDSACDGESGSDEGLSPSRRQLACLNIGEEKPMPGTTVTFKLYHYPLNRVNLSIYTDSGNTVVGLIFTKSTRLCLSLRPNWLPRPLSCKRVCPPWNQWGGGGGVQHALAVCGREEPILTTREKAWHSVYSAGKYYYCIRVIKLTLQWAFLLA